MKSSIEEAIERLEKGMSDICFSVTYSKEEEEEDLLFCLSASSEPVHEKAVNENCSRESLVNGITQETQEFMLNTMKQLILQLVTVSDLGHLHLLQTQLQEYKCIPRDIIQNVLTRQIQIMNEELKETAKTYGNVP